MSILGFFRKGAKPTFEEYASNKHLKAEKFSKDNNTEIYKNQLVSLTAAFFLNQAVSASAITGLPVTTNLAQNAKYSCGMPSMIVNTGSMGAYRFVEYCNAVMANPHLNNVGCSHNQNIFARNFLTNPNVDFQEDITNLGVVYDAVLATFAGTGKDASFVPQIDSSTLQFASMQYSKSPDTFFYDDKFIYPDGQITEGAKEATDKISISDPNAVGFALEILTRASGVFQQSVQENLQELNSVAFPAEQV